MAAKSGKNIFVVIGATWCTPCKIFWKQIHSEPFGPVLAKSYVLVQLHGYERGDRKFENKGTVELATKWSKGQIAGVPFYAVLSPSGKLLDTCMDGPEDGRKSNSIGTVGPAGDKLIEVIRATGKHAKPDELKRLTDLMHKPFKFDDQG